MSVTKKITRLEKSAARLEVTIPQDELRAAYEKTVSDIAGTIQIPGFRKGKVPLSVLERKLGSLLLEDVYNTIVGDTVKTILEEDTFPQELQPLPYCPPALEDGSPAIDLEKDLTFSAKWDVQPVVTVETWKGLTVEVADAAVEEADVARELEHIRERNAVVMDRQPKDKARDGDVVTVNYFEADAKNAPLPKTQREDFVFTVGSHANVYQFDDAVVGMKVGETKLITKDFPNDYDVSDLAGTHKVISLTLTALKENKLPELDDDLAQDVHEKFKTLDDLKKNIRQNLTRQLEDRLLDRKFHALMEKIVEKNQVAIPESMLVYEMRARLMTLCQRMGMSETEIRKVMADKNVMNEETMESQRPDTIYTLQAAFIQQKLIDELKIEVSEEERKAEYKSIAERRDVDIDQVTEFYTQDDRLADLDAYLGKKKLLDVLLKENTVKTGEKQSYRDFMGGDAE
jgi:trigger factor